MEIFFFEISAVLADDLVSEGVAGILVGQLDGRAELNRLALQARRVDHLRARSLSSSRINAALDEALLVFGSMIFRVFRDRRWLRA